MIHIIQAETQRLSKLVKRKYQGESGILNFVSLWSLKLAGVICLCSGFHCEYESSPDFLYLKQEGDVFLVN